MHQQDFTRKRKLSFVGLVVSQINLISKSISVELSKFIERFVSHLQDYSKQAFSQQRLKLKPEAFVDLNQGLLEEFYADDQLQTFQGYIVLAIDSTLLQLPESEAIISAYGLAENKAHSMPMSRSSLVYDVENKLVLQALAGKYTDDEQAMALQHLDYVSGLLAGRRCLILFDRGYPSLWLLACLSSKKLDYVLRCNGDFIKELADFAQSPQIEAWLELDLQTPSRQKNQLLQAWLQPGQKQLRVRAIKIQLPGGKVEYLLTSLPERQGKTGFRHCHFKGLYHKRWAIETGIDFHKNDLQLENFSARTVIGIQQDYHARILAANLTSLLVEDAQAELEAEPVKHPNKHHYQINRAVALGLIKDKLPDLLSNDEQVRQQVYQELIEKIKKRKTPQKPNRSFLRKTKLHYKFNINRRPVL
jgi:Transposase DDE domain